MNQIQLIPFKDCFTVDVTSNITALHETGHVITMYALGMMDHLAYVTTKTGSGTLGLTEMTDEYKATLTQLGNDIIQTAGNLHYGKDSTKIIQQSRVDAARLYFPNICRLFGGGAICRFYHVPDENMCSIDYNLIDIILTQFNLNGQRETLLPLVDQYLSSVFSSFDLLTKAIYKNLVTYETLTKDQVMQIVKEWEEYKLL